MVQGLIDLLQDNSLACKDCYLVYEIVRKVVAIAGMEARQVRNLNSKAIVVGI